MHTNEDERTADMANPAAKYTDEFGRVVTPLILTMQS